MKGAQALIEFGTPGPGGKGLRRTGLSMIAGRLCRTGLRPRSDVAEQREHEDLPAHHAPPILLVRLLGLGLESTPRLTLANFFFRPKASHWHSKRRLGIPQPPFPFLRHCDPGSQSGGQAIQPDRRGAARLAM